MATNAKIKTDIQKLNINSDLVELYVLDATALGGSVYYFTPGTLSGTAITFNGVEYSPLPVEITDIEWNGQGSLPRPKMRVSNTNLTFGAFVTSYNDGIGAKVTRKRTFRKYLDEMAEADPDAEFPEDIFYIEQKTAQNKYTIEWELISAVDFEDKYLPKNQVLEYCPHRYRVMSDEGFDYTDVTCPYTGTDYFTENGVTTTSGNDKCGKRFRDCRLRYPLDTDELPFKGFPTVGQVSRRYR